MFEVAWFGRVLYEQLWKPLSPDWSFFWFGQVLYEQLWKQLSPDCSRWCGHCLSIRGVFKVAVVRNDRLSG
jgi:hypothetical protein